MATIGNAPVFPTESVLPGNLQVTGNATVSGNATISGSSATVNGNEVRTLGTSGTVVQFVSATGTSSVATTSTTFIDCGISASITPISSSNKIVIQIVTNLSVNRSSDSAAGGIRILRDSTVIHDGPDSSGPTMSYVAAFGGGVTAISRGNYFSFLVVDSPSTTSSVTYKAQIAARSGTPSSTCSLQNTDGVPYITLMEIVA